jgi:hypothetical protein
MAAECTENIPELCCFIAATIVSKAEHGVIPFYQTAN